MAQSSMVQKLLFVRKKQDRSRTFTPCTAIANIRCAIVLDYLHAVSVRISLFFEVIFSVYIRE